MEASPKATMPIFTACQISKTPPPPTKSGLPSAEFLCRHYNPCFTRCPHRHLGCGGAGGTPSASVDACSSLKVKVENSAGLRPALEVTVGNSAGLGSESANSVALQLIKMTAESA